LDRLVDLSDRSDHRYRHLRPTVACYRGAIVAWAMSSRDDSGDRAVKILDRMEAKMLRPNLSCYRYAIVAVGKSKDKDKAENVCNILKRMETSFIQENRSAQLTAQIFVDALRAIGSTEGTSEALTSAFVFGERVLAGYHSLRAQRFDSEDDERVFLQFLWTASRLLSINVSTDSVVKEVLSRYSPAGLLQQSKSIQGSLRKVISDASTYDAIISEASKV